MYIERCKHGSVRGAHKPVVVIRQGGVPLLDLIFRLVYNYCKCDKPVKRLWISSLEEKAIKQGFANLKDGSEYNALYKAALCRTQADWLVGINATRLFSVLYGQTLNIGRAMTPTLTLITEREKELNSFVKEPFYTAELDCGDFTVSGERVKDKKSADDVKEICGGKTANVTMVERKKKIIQPLKLYDLTTLQREANRLHGFTAQQTLDYVQSLYEKKLATYPRTDSRFLTEDMDSTASDVIWLILAKFSYLEGIPLNVVDTNRITDNTKVSDHTAIIPTRAIEKADLSALPSGEKAILDMLAVRLVCAVSENHIFEEITVTVNCENHIFKSKGKTVVTEGWKIFDNAYRASLRKTAEKDVKETVLPIIFEGQVFNNVKSTVKEGFTSPPKHYTEDTLLSSMENAGANMPDEVERRGVPQCNRNYNAGLGTAATRAGIIEKLVKTGFIEREETKKAKNLIPTEKGKKLISILPELIKSPALTAEWENKLKLTERGELSAEEFISDIAEFVKNLIQTNTKADVEQFSFKKNAVGNCPRCEKSVREGTKNFYCENRDCGFTLWKDNKFFTAKKKVLTADIAAALLKDGRVFMSGLFSEKTGKVYDAYVILDDTGGKYVNFKLEFENKNR